MLTDVNLNSMQAFTVKVSIIILSSYNYMLIYYYVYRSEADLASIPGRVFAFITVVVRLTVIKAKTRPGIEARADPAKNL